MYLYMLKKKKKKLNKYNDMYLQIFIFHIENIFFNNVLFHDIEVKYIFLYFLVKHTKPRIYN